ncbi:uncharacterized protein LOC123556836 [Mercenaria mercenaria]|uniref:uncharacterized protein LOC123556836 n=1 Tax=Mercenaria mercenaria TaxID=6596 RepID=UPI00234FA401|nr:uncharacterized protein LOC123556836 [Mercenaria mercenaria]
MGLREVRARKESFFEKTLRSTRDSNSKICDCCRKKGIYTGAMYRCLDCQRNLCMPCLDFHETAINKHNLMNLFNREGKEESAGKLKGTLQSVSSTTVEFFPKSVQREKMAIVAIDLGSSRSGYTSIAFGMINEMAEGSITKMHLLQNWYTDFVCTTTPKSCLLFDEDQKPRHFGEEAFREYKELERKGKADCWYFFHKYDTYLRDENLTDKTKLCSANGKVMPAGKLFDALIDHLIRHFFRMRANLYEAEDMKLVFLVPEEPSATVLYMLKNAAVKVNYFLYDVSKYRILSRWFINFRYALKNMLILNMKQNCINT